MYFVIKLVSYLICISDLYFQIEMVFLVYFKDDLSWVAVNKNHPSARVIDSNHIEVDYGSRGCFLGRIIDSYGEFVTEVDYHCIENPNILFLVQY